MIVKKINYTTSELQRASGVAKDIPAVFSLYDSANQNYIWYRPKLMYTANGTGGAIGIVPMTSIEYTAYISGVSSFSSFYPVANSASGTFDNLKRQVTNVIVSGSAGASAALDIYFQYE